MEKCELASRTVPRPGMSNRDMLASGTAVASRDGVCVSKQRRLTHETEPTDGPAGAAAKPRFHGRTRRNEATPAHTRAKTPVFARLKKEDPRLRLRGSIPSGCPAILLTAPEGLALRPSHAPVVRLAKRLLQPALASGPVARWIHCRGESRACQVTQSSDFPIPLLTENALEHALSGGGQNSRLDV
jgi:hypothetical protein